MNTRKQGGFTLAEVMVGVVIALISMVAMFMIQENWDQQRRSIVSGGDAQIAGSISAFQIERDLRNGGSGFGNSAYLGCNVAVNDALNGAFTFTFAPVVITDGAGGLPDTLSILSGNSNSPTPTFDVAGATQAMTTMRDTRTGLALGELVVVVTPTPTTCRLLEIVALQAAAGDSGREVMHSGVASYSRTTAPPDNRVGIAAGACAGTGPWVCTPRYTAGAFGTYAATPPTYGELRSLGDDPRLNVWSVDNVQGRLLRRDRLHDAAAVEVGEGVIDLQAQYGLDTNGDDIIEWVDPAAVPNWTQLRAIRFALLSRGESYDRAAVTTAVPTWEGGAFVMRNVDGTPDSGAGNLGVNNWRNYRYAVFEMTVPLRNMIWRRFW